MGGCLTDITKTLVDKLLDKAIEKSRYLFCFTCIVKEFNEEKKKLKAESATMKQRFKVATEKGKDIQSNAEFWEKQADKLIQENTETKQRCFLGFCPDCIWRYKRGEDLATKIKEMKNLREEKFENIEITRCLPGAERYSSHNYISFKSRELKCKELLDALKDDNNYMVGLHGMGGTGKTTLAREVGKQLKTLENFKYVIDTTVSVNVDIKKIQDDIAGPLGLKWEDCNESDRPRRLWSRLTNGDKILVILDDVWENLNFDDIGIPKSDNHKGCKVLVTTRNLWVCNKMGCGKTIQLELLTEDDAWTMFKKHADLSNISSKSILDKGRKIAIECKRLPVAIATIASSLKGLNSREEWEVALNSLKNPVSMGNVEDDMVDIFKCLKFSYDYLKDEKAKGLFLLCSAFPEDEEISVELLTRLGIGVNLFGEGYEKYNDARSHVIAAKNKLLRSCLLLETEEGDVKMHDLVREVAHWIAKEEILVENLFEKNQKSLVEKSKNIKNLYFHGKLSELFSSKSHWSDGSKLKILIAKECEFQDVPTSFLKIMAGLRVLIFSNSYPMTHSSLAKSIKLMINIRSLSVKKVILGDISVLGSLQRLETLELHSCEIDEFPPEIAKLDKLRLLCLEECEIKRNNPFEVIQRCPSLEELYFCLSFNDFCQEITLPPTTLERYLLIDKFSDWNGSQSKGVALEGDCLSEATYKYVMKTSYYLHLIRIQGWINLMPEMVPIDQGMNDLIELHLEDSSQLQFLVDTKHNNSQEPIVFSKLAVLELERMEALEELCNGPISSDSMNNLKKLYIKECENLQSLFKCSLNLSNLKTMTLISCSRLVSVFKLSTSQSLPLLVVNIEEMEKLEELFNGPISFDCMNNLEKLSVKACKNLQSLFKCSLNLSNLKTVTLISCSRLVSVFELSTSQSLPLLEELKIVDCEKLENIITFERRAMDDTIVESVNGYNDNKSCYSLFPKLKVLCIEECHQLQFILPILSAQDLLFLEDITIKCCHKLKYIFGQHQDAKLPSLKQFGIVDLPNFIDIFPPNASSISKDGSKPQTQLDPIKRNTFSMCCYGYKLRGTKIPLVSEDQPQDCSISLESNSYCLLRQSHIPCNIKEIHIYNVPTIKSVFILSIALRMLETLRIENCDELKQIIIDTGDHNRTGGNNFGNLFPKLKTLFIQNCVQLEYIFGYQNQTECPQLASGDFITRRSMDGTIVKELSGNEENGQQMNLSLEEIELSGLPMMRCLFVGLKYSFVLNNLTTMKIVRCEQLEIVFSTSVLRCLPQLVSLKVEECKELKHIIEDDLEDKVFQSSNTFFLKLETVLVTKCDKLKYIFPVSICKDVFPQLVNLEVQECSELKYIIEDDLEDKVFQSSVDHNSTGGNNFGNVFPQLKRFHVENCVQSEYIFGHYSYDHQKQTEMAKLELNECPQLTSGDFIKELSGNEENGQQMNLSLEDIKLVNLPMMRYLFVGFKYSFVLKNLKKMKIVRCEKLESVFSTSVLRCLPQLVRLEVQDCKELKHIIEEDLEIKISQFSNTCFPMLETLIVRECDKLKYVFPVSICKEFPELKVMVISEANELEEIFKSDKNDEIEEISKSEVEIPNLERIAFVNLPSLRHAQGVHFQTVKYCFVLHCQKLSLTSATSHDTFHDDSFSIGDNAGDENPSAETTKDFAVGSEIQEASEHQLTSLQLKGSTSEITATTNVSTITETKNKPPAQEVDSKQKGIHINVEEGNISANAKKITSSTHFDGVGSSSSQLVTSECKTSSQDDGDSQIEMTSFSISTSESNDQGSLNHDSFKKVSLNIEEQLPKEQFPYITFPVLYQFFPVPCEEELFKGDNAGDENPSAETTIDFAAGSEVQEASEHQLTSLQLEGPTSEITAAATVSTITQEVVPKQKGIEINVEEGNTSANAKTITSSTQLDVAGSSSGQLVTSGCKTSSQEDIDSQIAMTSFSVFTSESNDQGSLNHDSFKKVSSNIEEQFPKNDDITVSKSKPSLSITSPVAYQFTPVPCKEDPSQKVQDLSSLLFKSELEQLVSKNHLDCGNLSLLTDFFVKHPSVRLKDTSLSNRYKGCAYNLLAELLKFLKTHNVLEVLGSFHSEFLELLQDARSFGFDKDWLDGVERRALFPDIQVSQDALQKLLDSKQQVTKDVEVLRLKIGILSQQLTSSEAVLESIIQQEVVLSAPIGY